MNNIKYIDMYITITGNQGDEVVHIDEETESTDEFSDAEVSGGRLFPNQLEDPDVYARYIAQFNGN